MAPPRRYNLNNSSRPSSGSANGPGTSSPSPAPAAGSTGANSTPSPASASAPGWMVASATWAFWGSLIILTSLALRWIPFNWGLMLFFAILGGGASLLLKKSKTISFFRWMAGGIILTTILSAWFFPQLPAAVESYQPGVPSPQEQITQSLTPSPNPDWRRETLPSSNKAIVIERSGTIILPEGKKRLFFSHMGDETGDLSPVITIAGKDYSAKGAGDFLLPEEVKGKVKVNFNGWDDKSYPGGLDAYQYYKAKKPFIELVE